MSAATFDLTGPLPRGRMSLEASAGTGKTYTIAGLVVRYVGEGVAELDQLLVVTFTRAATAELRERIRRRLADAAAHLDRVDRGGDPAHDDPVIALLADRADRKDAQVRLEKALANFDAATITTIHGFCHQVLATAGFAGDVDGRATLVEEVDDLVAAVTHDLLVRDFGSPGTPQEDRPSLADAREFLRLALRDTSVELRPPADDPDEPARARALVRLAEQAREEVDRRKRAQGLMTFDDLLGRLRASLRDPAAAAGITATMRDRYRIALIDEFQDTDPVQWEILDRLFADATLVLIGDPKQAIYRFRGADIHAYLDATQADGAASATLGTNWRSDARLVAVTNRLFAGTRFGDDRIRHHDVSAADTLGEDRLVFDDGPREVLQVRVVVEGSFAADAVRARIARDLAAEVTGLLASAPTIHTADGPRAVAPGDCAVLVRTNAQAEDVKDQLLQAGVHAVIGGVGSVLDTPAAQDWGRLLDALERPGSGTRVRALALSPLVGATPADLADGDEEADAARHQQAHRWARVLRDHGVAALLRTIARETDLLPRLLAQEGGERWLTDLEHVGTLLHQAMSGERLGPAALHAWLVDQTQRTDELPADQRARRLESDARAVQILTIHRAKGLQFPVVFCPYVMSTGGGVRPPFHHHDPATGRAVVDAGSNNAKAASAAVAQENAGELLRLLYVALTRAEHRCVVWWFPFNVGKHGYARSPLSKLLFNARDTEARETDPRVTVDTDAPRLAKGGDQAGQMAGWLDGAIGALGGDAAWTAVPRRPTAVAWSSDGEGAPDLQARPFTGQIDRAWRRTSYSGLIRPRADALVASTPDNAVTHDDEHDVDAAEPLPAGDPLAVALPLHDQPAGARFGTLVHAVMEHADLDADDLDVHFGEVVARVAAGAGVDLPAPQRLAEGLALAACTPLGEGFGGVALAGTPRSDRLDELEFELPVVHGDGALTLAAIADLLDDHLPADDPFTGYADRLRDPALARQVRGFLGGSIDLVLRRHTDGGPVFHVIDHKTNRTYPASEQGTAWHYRRHALVAAMVHGHYPLQALLYGVALHRFLRWRLDDYDPDRHLGATGYLFLRGMVGPDAPVDGDAPCGVMTWRPPTALVRATSDLLDGGAS